VLDRVGRLQLPQEYLTKLSLRDRVRLELEPDHVQVHPTEPAAEPADSVVDPAETEVDR
jgi:hypothetical protein